MDVGGGRRLGVIVAVAVAALLVLSAAALTTSMARAQSEEGTVEETTEATEDTQAAEDDGEGERAEKKVKKDDAEADTSGDGASAETDDASAQTGDQTDEQAQEDDTTTTDDTSGLESLTAAQVQNFSCVQVRQYFREVVVGDSAGEVQYNALERRAIECQTGDVILDTVPGGKLPNTGGLPLVGGVVLALALLGTGISIVRAGSRRR